MVSSSEITYEPSMSLKIVYSIMVLLVIIWGLTFPAVRSVATSDIGKYPFIIAFYRYLFAIPMLIIFTKLIDKKIAFPKEYAKEIIILGILEISLYQFLFISGLRFTSASDAGMILNPTISFVTALYAAKMYADERLSLNWFIGIILSITGVALIFVNSPNPHVENRLFGNFLIIATAITYAVYAVNSRPLFQKIPVLTFQLWATIAGWIVISIFALYQQITADPYTMNQSDLWWIVYLAFAAAVGNAVMSIGIKNIGPTKASAFINFIPLSGVILSNLILHENFSILYIVSFTLISIGVYLINRKKS